MFPPFPPGLVAEDFRSYRFGQRPIFCPQTGTAPCVAWAVSRFFVPLRDSSIHRILNALT